MIRLPVIALLGGIAAPLLMAGPERAVPVSISRESADPRMFWPSDTGDLLISPVYASIQIKRVAANRGLPYYVVRQLVEDNTHGNGVDIAALNQALATQ